MVIGDFWVQASASEALAATMRGRGLLKLARVQRIDTRLGRACDGRAHGGLLGISRRLVTGSRIA